MDKIDLMENILKQYKDIEKAIKDSENDKRRGRLLVEKETERYDEAKEEFGEHTVSDYERKVLQAYESNIKEYQENLDKINESVAGLNKKKEFMSNDKNIQDITQGLMEIEKQINQKELELKKSELELSEYYTKEDKGGKIVQDFYNEQDAIRKEINNLTNKKEKFEKFLDELKIGRDKLIKDGNYLEANKEVEAANTVPIDRGETEQTSENSTAEIIDDKQQPDKKEEVNENQQSNKTEVANENQQPNKNQTNKNVNEKQPSGDKQSSAEMEMWEQLGVETNKPATQDRAKNNSEANDYSKTGITDLVKIDNVLCSVKDGKIFYTISGVNSKGENFEVEKSAEPKRASRKEKRSISQFINKVALRNVDINLYRILGTNKNFKNTDAAMVYLDQVERITDGADKGISDIKLTYDLTNLRKADISGFKKWQLKRFARNSERYNIADYIKPQGRLKALMGKVKQGLLTAGKQEEKETPYSREDDVYSTYKMMRGEEGFDFDRFCEDMDLSEEERKTLESYEKVNSSKKSFHKGIKSETASHIPSESTQQKAEIKKEKEENQNVHDEI